MERGEEIESQKARWRRGNAGNKDHVPRQYGVVEGDVQEANADHGKKGGRPQQDHACPSASPRPVFPLGSGLMELESQLPSLQSWSAQMLPSPRVQGVARNRSVGGGMMVSAAGPICRQKVGGSQ
ncbi:hypothetical protein SCAR479_13192 [Seiridium cardinale]|uniref:Uncharacterized protein n=1 Tax=Seiridium cardinale TaxID=138064 RepID=A0ABR2X8Q6_9PEZI